MKLWENLYVPGHLFTIFKLNSLVKDSFQTLIKQKTSLSSFLYNVGLFTMKKVNFIW